MAGPQCCESAPQLHPGVGIGRVETFEHLSVYVTASPDAKAAVILISDIFGFEAPNLRKLADKVAAAGYFVVVPDFFYGDPFVPGSAENPLAGFQDWIKSHGPAKGFDDSTKVIEVLKSRGISAIGAAGFCWGAKVVVELTKGEVLKAGVLLHPSFVTVDDIKVVKAPLAILGGSLKLTNPVHPNL
uniref:Dienelactone hydrolase domain-containing protein n=1 Tax=Picea sitchensis TaxID=3332 RepID=A9NL20_PICSI|nr:unknown [Picea sitchensis]